MGTVFSLVRRTDEDDHRRNKDEEEIRPVVEEARVERREDDAERHVHDAKHDRGLIAMIR